MSVTVLPSVEGDALQLDDTPHRTYLLPPCDAATPRAWYCLSCRILLANQGQKEIHCESGVHVLAIECRRHGWEATGIMEPVS